MVFSQEIRQIVESITPTVGFLYADWEEVRYNLISKGRLKAYDGTKYPLIVMQPLGVKQSIDANSYEGADFKATFYLIAESKQNYTYEERDIEIYTNVLYPLWNEFVKQTIKSNVISYEQGDDLTKFEYEIEHLYFKSSEKIGQNQIKDVVDAVRIDINLIFKR